MMHLLPEHFTLEYRRFDPKVSSARTSPSTIHCAIALRSPAPERGPPTLNDIHQIFTPKYAHFTLFSR